MSFADDEFERLSRLYTETVGQFVTRGQPFALLDFPDYSNVGDSAIYLGELAFFDRFVGRRPAYVGTLKSDPGEVVHLLPEGPVFIQGGGNFGDLWPKHQAYFRRVLKKLRNRKIVQLPQSIYFSDLSAARETADAIARHGNVTLLVRDQPSRDFAERHFDCSVAMCPDAAVNLFRIDAPTPSTDILSILRTDHESVWRDAADILGQVSEVCDWPIPNVKTLNDRLLSATLELTRLTRDSAMAHREDMYRRRASARVEAGVAKLATARLIVSDRLHVHLISALIRRPHIVLDNSYGKIKRHMEAWGDFGLASRVNTTDELKALLHSPAPNLS